MLSDPLVTIILSKPLGVRAEVGYQCVGGAFESSPMVSILIVAGRAADRWVVRGIAIGGMSHY